MRAPADKIFFQRMNGAAVAPRSVMVIECEPRQFDDDFCLTPCAGFHEYRLKKGLDRADCNLSPFGNLRKGITRIKAFTYIALGVRENESLSKQIPVQPLGLEQRVQHENGVA
jgi:hypothetical protein